MRYPLFSSVLRSIFLVTLAGFIAFAGEDKAKAPDSLKAELTEEQNIQLNWIGTENAKQFGIYRAEVYEMPQDLDYSELKFTKVETVKKPEYTDKVLTEEAKTESSPALLVYYVTAIDKAGKEGTRSDYAEVNLLVEPEEKTIN